jgi:DNA primase large subunit
MSAFPKEVNVLLGRAGVEQIKGEQWGAFDMFRRVILEHNKEIEQGLGIKLARPFYEKFLQHLLMFDDVFLDLEKRTDQNETALMILDHIKGQLAGKHYKGLKDRRDGATSTIMVEKALVQRILARRAEKNSLEALIKYKFMRKQFEEEGEHLWFQLKGDEEFAIMRDTLAYAAMVEALQTSSKPDTRAIGHRLAKENYLRVMLAHHILDAREGFRVKGEVLERVRTVIDALDQDDNGVLSLLKAGEGIDEDVSPHKHPELWKKLRSYDSDGDGFLTGDEQIRLKEAIAGLIQRGVDFESKSGDFLTFEEAERILAKELPLSKK